MEILNKHIVEHLEKIRTQIYAGNYILARRYIDNAVALLVCSICKEPLGDEPDEQYYKAHAHTRCIEQREKVRESERNKKRASSEA